jgi:Fe-Mn family superoxide dismutase
LEKIEPREELKPTGLIGISDKQIDFHFNTHYKGYVNKLNEILEKLETADRSKANQNYSEYRALKVEETFNHMGVVLHELYFENLKNGRGTKPGEKLTEMINKNFGSMEKWKEDFKACGTAHRGWALLVFDLSTGRLINNGLDAHNVYNLSNAIPLLVLDVYEHAYYVDYGPKRAPYLDAFLENVNWEVVNRRLERALRLQG